MDIEQTYLNEISKTDLLSREKEYELAKRVQQGDMQAREHLISANLKLVVKIAHVYKNLGVSTMDLIAEGNIGLMKAAERYDPDKGAKFSSYAAWWIKQRVKSALTNQSKTVRLPAHLVNKIRRIRKVQLRLSEELGRPSTNQEVADKMNVNVGTLTHWLEVAAIPTYIDAELQAGEKASFADVIADKNAKTPFQNLNDKHIRQDVVNLIERLDQREKDILTYRFGLGGTQVETLERVGTRYSLSRERVRQIQEATVKKLGEMLNENTLTESAG